MKKIVFDESMGAAGDMIAAALLDLFDDPEEVVNEINQIIKDSNLEDVVTEVVDKVRDNISGLEFNVDIKGEEEMSEDYNHFDTDERRYEDHRDHYHHEHPHHFNEHPHHDHYEEFRHRYMRPDREYKHDRCCKHRPPHGPFGMMQLPNINIKGPIELHIDLFFGDTTIEKPSRKKHRHHRHHHHHKHHCNDRNIRDNKASKKRTKKVTSSMHVGKDHLNA